jgi:hypothetical protein
MIAVLTLVLGCKDCAYSYHKAVEGHGILIRMNVLQMYCFDCKRLVSF